MAKKRSSASKKTKSGVNAAKPKAALSAAGHAVTMAASPLVRVRLVPKPRGGVPLTATTAPLASSMASAFAPDVGHAIEGTRRAMAMGLRARATPKHAIDVQVPREQFKERFGVSLREASPQSSDTSDSSRRMFLVPDKEVPVPKELRDTVDFAYVPTPPQYFGMRALSPDVSLRHHSLLDVVTILRAGRCHRKGWTGKGIRLAMTDTGFEQHPFFIAHGYAITRVTTPSTSDPTVDTIGHGTGESANALAIAPDVQFLGVKHDDYSAEALETAIALSPRIVTNSWGWNIDTQTLAQLKAADPNQYNEIRDVERIIGDAVQDGIVMIFSAGNGHRAFPACLPACIAAGGVDVHEDGDLEASTYASSFRSMLFPGRAVPDFCGIVGASAAAPMPGHIMLPVPDTSELDGENMPTAAKGKGWGIFSGTSAAAPQTAGVVALLLSVEPTLTPAQVSSILTSTARDVVAGSSGLGDPAGPGADLATGAGLIDAWAACNLAAGGV